MVKLFQGILGQVLGQIMGGFILMQSGLFTGVVECSEIFRAEFMIFLYYIIFYIFIFNNFIYKKYTLYTLSGLFTGGSGLFLP